MNKEDFKNCLFNPLEKNLLTTYPRLAELGTKDEKLLRYVIFLYDPGSPLIKEFKDLTMRKRQAASLAGMDLKKDLEPIYSFTDQVALNAVDVYLKSFISSRLWYIICGREQTVYEYAQRMMKPIEVKVGSDEQQEMKSMAIKSTFSKDLTAINDALEADLIKFFGNDDDLAKAKRKGFTPEDMAGKV
jgi:hypothetical protein